MFDVLPPELVLSILSYLPIRQLQRLCQVSKFWNLFLTTNEEKIYHAAAILHGFVPPQTKSLDSIRMPKWLEDVHSWKAFCHKYFKTDRRWEGQEPSYSSHVGAAGKAVWRFKVDEEQQTVISTHFDGGLRVSPFESCGSDILWLLPHSEVHGYAHVEFTNGFMVFTRRGDAIDVWRRKRDARNAFRPPTLYNDYIQLRAQNIAWQSGLSISQDDRGAFVPWTTILPSHSIHALRAVNSKLLLASQRVGEAYVYDLPTGQLLQTIQFRDREDPLVDVSYVELGQRHAFICTRSDVLIFPLDPSSSHVRASLRFPTDVEGLDEVFRQKTYSLKYSDFGEPIYASTIPRRSNLVPCVLSRETPDDPVIWHCNAVHVSPCGSHFITTDGLGNICIVRDFERALREGTSLRDNITIVNMGFPIMYLAYENDHRIAVYVDDRGVFVLPHIMDVTVSIDTYTMEPVKDMVVLHARQDLHLGVVQLCSCLQLSRSELWYSWTRMHTRPGRCHYFTKTSDLELGIANNVLRRIDFSNSSEPQTQPRILNQGSLS
ncbi:hypothetical protein Clacol_007473 [Clathrus columnatus]|uniref:F-box domain-containing protein n=1 Tax=Clathrus columnatus TaxID=1419009 RepID=A0AAV5AHK6_9AGAM|nr:hypothetical protein Clacol_007473 [Clathrus columnatus]